MTASTLPPRRCYDATVKLRAAQLVREQNLRVCQVCDDLNGFPGCEGCNS